MHFDTNEDLIDFYSRTLLTLWERYLTLNNVVLTLAGGTSLLFLNAIKPAEWLKSANVGYAVAALVLSGIALVLSILWRIASQHFMEHETLGRQEEADRYFQLCNIKPVTLTFRKRPRAQGLYRFVFKCTPLPTILLLLGSWAMMMAFLTSAG